MHGISVVPRKPEPIPGQKLKEPEMAVMPPRVEEVQELAKEATQDIKDVIEVSKKANNKK